MATLESLFDEMQKSKRIMTVLVRNDLAIVAENHGDCIRAYDRTGPYRFTIEDLACDEWVCAGDKACAFPILGGA